MKHKIFIVADDLTGALDTGVQFSKRHLQVQIKLLPWSSQEVIADDIDVLIVCTQSRHLPAPEAKKLVQDLFAVARNMDYFDCYFKKIDSTLRGNIGSELEGMAAALSPKRIHLLNAFPAAGRTTSNGLQYVYGVPLNKTSFAQDPFNPILSASIKEIISSQTELINTHPETLCIHDASTDADILKAVHSFQSNGELYALVGCAGLADSLAQLWQKPASHHSHFIQGRPLILCGSLNAIATEQLAYAQETGMQIQTLPEVFFHKETAAYSVEAEQILNRFQTNNLIIQTPKPAVGSIKASDGQIVASSMGHLFASLLQEGLEAPVLIVGGDTLVACIEKASCQNIQPLGEPFPGTVLFQADCNGKTHFLLSKAGGFGEKSMIVDVAELMKGGISL